jgi:hypothetical protein
MAADSWHDQTLRSEPTFLFEVLHFRANLETLPVPLGEFAPQEPVDASILIEENWARSIRLPLPALKATITMEMASAPPKVDLILQTVYFLI